jgi:hypothetical protein
VTCSQVLRFIVEFSHKHNPRAAVVTDISASGVAEKSHVTSSVANCFNGRYSRTSINSAAVAHVTHELKKKGVEGAIFQKLPNTAVRCAHHTSHLTPQTSKILL